jgi:hypothetical protein
MNIDVIYCSGANKRFMQIALDAGELLGVQSGRLDYGFPISFVDIDYKKPDFTKHLAMVAKFKPRYAVVPDLSETEDSEEDTLRAVKQADLLGVYCEYPLIVPKRSGQLRFIPSRYAIAYSIWTSYGGAQFGIWKLANRRIHLLGGSPQEQMKLYRYHPGIMSADGNMAQKMATVHIKFWRARRWLDHPEKMKCGVKEYRKDLYVECWRMSCSNISQQWKREVSA